MSNEFPDGSYVELLPGCEEVYTAAVAGSRGWIRARKDDDYEYGKVYVEWDKEHWRFNGEPDGWTFASHFRLAPEEPDLMGLSVLSDPAELIDREEEMEQYIDAIASGFDQAAESDGFYLITMKRIYDDELGMEIVFLETHRGAADSNLDMVSEADILRFVEERKRQQGM